jgi:hypothetical protein
MHHPPPTRLGADCKTHITPGAKAQDPGPCELKGR